MKRPQCGVFTKRYPTKQGVGEGSQRPTNHDCHRPRRWRGDMGRGEAFLGKKGPRRTPLIPKKPPNGWTFCAFAPLPGCVWSSPFCPPAEVSGRKVAGRGSGQRKSTQLPGCDQIPFLRFLERVRENFLARSFPAQPHSFQKSPRRMAGAVLFDSVYFPTHRVRR